MTNPRLAHDTSAYVFRSDFFPREYCGGQGVLWGVQHSTQKTWYLLSVEVVNFGIYKSICMRIAKKGVLLVNLGTPDSYKTRDVAKYLKQFLLDPRVIDIAPLARQILVRGIIVPFRSPKSAKVYKELWTEEGSPLKAYGYALRDKVQEELGGGYEVVLGMRYQNPSLNSALDELKAKGVDEIVVFPLFPQYASATTGSVFEEVMDIIKTWQTFPKLTFVNEYHDNPGMIRIFAQNGGQFDLKQYDHILMSFHGLPQRQLRKADTHNHCLKSDNCCSTLCEKNKLCYSAQCHGTAQSIARELSLSEQDYTVCFQSRLGKDPWIQPYTEETIRHLAANGARRLLVFCPAFTADCLETTIEIGEEYDEVFKEVGGERIDLVPSLNDSAEWARVVGEMILAS